MKCPGSWTRFCSECDGCDIDVLIILFGKILRAWKGWCRPKSTFSEPKWWHPFQESWNWLLEELQQKSSIKRTSWWYCSNWKWRTSHSLCLNFRSWTFYWIPFTMITWSWNPLLSWLVQVLLQILSLSSGLSTKSWCLCSLCKILGKLYGVLVILLLER